MTWCFPIKLLAGPLQKQTGFAIAVALHIATRWQTMGRIIIAGHHSLPRAVHLCNQPSIEFLPKNEKSKKLSGCKQVLKFCPTMTYCVAMGYIITHLCAHISRLVNPKVAQECARAGVVAHVVVPDLLDHASILALDILKSSPG